MLKMRKGKRLSREQIQKYLFTIIKKEGLLDKGLTEVGYSYTNNLESYDVLKAQLGSVIHLLVYGKPNKNKLVDLDKLKSLDEYELFIRVGDLLALENKWYSFKESDSEFQVVGGFKKNK
jgi:hypothetical protein